MFGIGSPEFIVIAVVALVVLGPERIPDVMRRIGQFYRQAREMSDSLTSELRQQWEEGMRAKVTVRKNKVAPPFKSCEFDIMWDEGISKSGNLLDVGTEMGLIKKSGAHFSFGDTRIGLGRENAKEFLRQNPEVAADLERQIRSSARDFKAIQVTAADA